MRDAAQIALTIALLVVASVGLPALAEEVIVAPPLDIWVTPLAEGGALNISWGVNGTNATSFHIYLHVGDGVLVPLGTATAVAPWYVHRGLTNGNVYTYVIRSDDANGEPQSPPSEEVWGVPRSSKGNNDTIDTPVLSPILPYTNSEEILIKGMVPNPGSTVEVEVVPLDGGMSSNNTTVSDVLTGGFSLCLELSEGPNLIHARCIGTGSQTSPWCQASYVTVDLEPPELIIEGLNQKIEANCIAYLNAGASTDNIGLASISWYLSSPIEETICGPTFSYIFCETGRYTLEVTALDLAGNQATTSVALEVESFNKAPTLVNLPDSIKIFRKGHIQLDMSDWVVDEDDSSDSLKWSVNVSNTSLVTASVDRNTLSLVGTEGGSGSADLYLRVEDPSGNSAEGTVEVRVSLKNVQTGGQGFYPMGLITFGAVLLLGIIVKARRWTLRDRGDQAGTKHNFFIKSIYFVHSDGRLIFDYHSTDEPIKDSDMVSSMFTAIQDFIKTSFAEEGSLDNLTFGQNNLTITRGKHVYLATVSLGPVDNEFLAKAEATVRRIEARYAGIIEEWDGAYAKLTGMKDLLTPLMFINEGRTPEDVEREHVPQAVQCRPSVDFIHGYVRYCLEVTNNTEQILVDAFADLEWDKEVLSLKEVQPKLERIGKRIYLGNIPSGGTQAAHLYFDPQLCLESFIRGSLSYLNIKGHLKTITLDSTHIDVNCPIFFTVGNANTAMLKRLVDEEIEHKDNKVIRFTSVINAKQIFHLAKAVVSSYDIRFVQEFVMDEPFIGEAWYYGETKVHNYRVVVRMVVREEDQTVEFMVAASLPTTITGLLAELGHLFILKMDEKFTHGYNVYRVVSKSIKDSMREEYMKQPSLYDRIVSGAADNKGAPSQDASVN